MAVPYPAPFRAAVIARYLRRDEGVVELIESAGINMSTLYNWLHKENAPLRGLAREEAAPADLSTVTEAVRIFHGGKSQIEVAKAMRVGVDRISRWLRQAGVPTDPSLRVRWRESALEWDTEGKVVLPLPARN